MQGSILASPALYKNEQNGAPSQSGGVGELSGARSLEAVVSVGRFLASVSSVGEFGVASRWRESRVVDRDEWRASASRWREP